MNHLYPRLYQFLYCLIFVVLLFNLVQCATNVKQLCASKDVDINDGLIIDIKTSVAYGAKVLGGTYEESTEACASSCCNIEGCDLALYKKEGVSSSGKNCYYMRCGVLANCKMVRHEGFASVVMMKSGNEQATQDISKEDLPKEPVPTQHTHRTKETSTPATSPVPTTLPSPVSTTLPSSASPSTNGPLLSTGSQTAVLPNLSSAEEVGNQAPGLGTTTIDDCDKDGCAGLGVIVTATVGAIGLLLVLVVTLVIVKRTYDLHKRRKFTNVDYLINGMYA